MKKIVVLLFTLFSFGCSSTNELFPKDFDRFGLILQENLSGTASLEIADSAFTYVIPDGESSGSTGDCNGGFAVSTTKMNELRNLVADIELSPGDKDFFTVKDFIGLDLVERIYKKGSCDEGQCETISKTDFCNIQTFLINLLEDAGKSTGDCHTDAFDAVLQLSC